MVVDADVFSRPSIFAFPTLMRSMKEERNNNTKNSKSLTSIFHKTLRVKGDLNVFSASSSDCDRLLPFKSLSAKLASPFVAISSGSIAYDIYPAAFQTGQCGIASNIRDTRQDLSEGQPSLKPAISPSGGRSHGNKPRLCFQFPASG